jgi:hypothetical protein
MRAALLTLLALGCPSTPEVPDSPGGEGPPYQLWCCTPQDDGGKLCTYAGTDDDGNGIVDRDHNVTICGYGETP